MIIPGDNVKTLPLYTFYRHKYGQELLIDVLSLDYVKEGIRSTPVPRESFSQIILFTQGSEEVAIDGCRRTMRPARRCCVATGAGRCRGRGYVIKHCSLAEEA